MAQILVRNLEDRLKGRLQRRAKQHGHSMEAEAREILRNALKDGGHASGRVWNGFCCSLQRAGSFSR